eukprot:2072817-Alexandrium_andersonii.AAC.1
MSFGDFLEAMNLDPQTAEDRQLLDAAKRRALDGLNRYGVGVPVPREQVLGKQISARWRHVWVWSAEAARWEIKSRYVAH